MKLDCTTPKYETLYARWLVDPDKLLDATKLQPGERVVDLCGGTGLVANAALARHALQAIVVDLAPRVHGPARGPEGLSTIKGRAEKLDELILDERQRRVVGALVRDRWAIAAWYKDFDLVVCRQAIGYLDIEATARAVARVLKPGGRFAFNTFVKPKWSFKRYWFQGHPFVEASGFLGHTVWHLQASPTIGWDITRFRWHREADLDRALAPFFKITKTRTAKTLTYVCTRYNEDRYGTIPLDEPGVYESKRDEFSDG